MISSSYMLPETRSLLSGLKERLKIGLLYKLIRQILRVPIKTHDYFSLFYVPQFYYLV